MQDILSTVGLKVRVAPPRKYFTMSETGKEFYKNLESTWLEISTAVNKITQQTTKINL